MALKRQAGKHPMKKLLIVDDSKAMRMIIRRSLTQIGLNDVEVKEATNGEEAVGRLQDEQFDLVLADWNMPQMTGIDLLKSIRAKGNGVSFGFITSEGTDESRQEALDAGALFLLVKPFTPEALQSTLHTFGLA